MKSGYNIFWTPNAKKELEKTLEYLEKNFTDRELKKLAVKIEEITELISHNPHIFPLSDNKKVRKTVILKFNTMYYRVLNEDVEILSFFSNRQSPTKRKLQ